MTNKQPLIPSFANEDTATLQQRFAEYGYLFIKNYVPNATCNALLNEILAVTSPYVSATEDTQTPQYNGEAFFETDAIWDEVYPKIQSLESFHSFFHQPHMLELMQKAAGKDVFVYPMKMARISTPGKIGYETPPHQDAHSHNAGPTMAGIWVALHDAKHGMGRLMMLPHSHQNGVRKVFEADGVGGIQCEIYDDETTWHVSDVEQGDVIIFHSCCVHKAEPNTAESAARISIDTRFCDYGAPVFSTNLEPHHGWRIEGLDWDAIYQNWQHKSYQYYWRDYPNLF